MIINANGVLMFGLNAGTERLDNDGYPIVSGDTWDGVIECHIKTNTQATVGVTTNGNVFEASAYEVLIEQQEFNAKVVRLVRDGVELGEFQVQGEPEYLTAVGNTKIMVRCLSNV